MKFTAVAPGNDFGKDKNRGSREGRDARIARIARFFGRPENQVFIPMGKLFWNASEAVEQVFDKSIQGCPVDELEVGGLPVPVAENHFISINNISEWGCLVCGSCEGSGVHPSPNRNDDRFMGSDWFYNVHTQRLVTFSATCHAQYIAVEHKARFVDGATWQAQRKELAKGNRKPKGQGQGLEEVA